MSDTDQTRVMGTPSDRTMVAPAGAGMGATQQMPVGGMGADAFQTQMGGVTICPVCKSTTPLPEIYCGDCGFLLSATPGEEVAAPVEEAPAAELVDVTDGRRYRLHPGVNTLGRLATDVLVNENTVSRTHARLVVEGSTVTVEDLGSSNGTKVGDRRIGPNQPTPATQGTPLKFGNWRVMLEIGGVGAGSAEQTVAVPSGDKTMWADRTVVAASITVPAVATPAAEPLPEPANPTAHLDGTFVAVLQKMSGPASDIPIPPGTITIGRKPGNTILLTQDAYISGRHVEIKTDNTGTYLTDVGSTNGTVVNGIKLDAMEPQLLLEGDEILLGQGKYKFVLMDAPEEAGDAAETPSAGEAETDAPMHSDTSVLSETPTVDE